MGEVVQQTRLMALEDAKDFKEHEDFAKNKINFALRILSNASNRFADKCDLIAKVVDQVSSKMPSKFITPSRGHCNALKATLEDVQAQAALSASKAPEAFDVSILRKTNEILSQRNMSGKTIEKPELYQYYLSRALKMRKMLSGLSMCSNAIADIVTKSSGSGSDDALSFTTHVSVIHSNYVEKIVKAMDARYRRLESNSTEMEATSTMFEQTLREIQIHYQNVERILLNLTIVQEGLKVLEPFLLFHNKLAGTLGVPVWHGTDEEWDATKLHKVVKGDKWKRMESASGLPLEDVVGDGDEDDDDEPFRLNPYHTYLLGDPQSTARDFSMAMDEARRYFQKLLQEKVKKKKAGCKTGGKGEGSQVEYVFVDMAAMRKALAARRGGGRGESSVDDVLKPAPFPSIYRPPVHLAGLL